MERLVVIGIANVSCVLMRTKITAPSGMRERKRQQERGGNVMISVIVLSRREAEKFELSNKQACISIYTPGDEPAKIQGGHVLPLCFHDLNDPNLKDKLMSSLHDPDRVFPV